MLGAFPVRGGVLSLLCLASVATAAPGVSLRSAVLGQVAPRNEALGRAQALIDDGEFEAAVPVLEKAIDAPEMTDDQLAELYRLLGLSHLYLGNEERARDAFEKLLQARPDYELPRATPPKIRTLYARIKDDVRKRRVRPVTLSLTPPTAVEGGRACEVPAHIEDMALGAKARLFYRRAGAQAFSSADFVREKGSRTDFHALIPAFELPAEDAAWEVEFYVEVADAAQRRLAGKGDAYAPLTFTVASARVVGGTRVAPASGGWYTNPWVWVGVGVGVAAVTTGAVLVASQQKTGTLPITIQVEGTP